MISETIVLGRRQGKTQYLIERIQEAQDAGAELVAVVVPTANEAQRWADHVVEWEIDPSRFIVFSVGQVEYGVRGLKLDRLYVDNADLMTAEQLQDLEQSCLRGIDVATYTG